MFFKFRFALGVALLLSLVLVIPTFAGGWAIITLDELPTDVVAGEPFTVGFTVLQHGKTPMDGLEPTITAILSKDEQFKVIVKPYGAPGHYAVDLTFPKDGEWNWSIQAFTMDQPMPTLSVAAPVVKTASQPVVKSVPATEPNSLLPIVRVTAFGIGLVGLIVAFLRKSRLAIALTVLCLLVGVGTFATASTIPAVEAQRKSSSEEVTDASISQIELGRQLFIAKGCITCHANEKAVVDSSWGPVMKAPNLSSFSASPETLRLRLKDPSAVKSDTWMPDLDLSDAEIEALIAFINSK